MTVRFQLSQLYNELLAIPIATAVIMSNHCTPDVCYSNLWQFKCESCPGKNTDHPYNLWYDRVSGDNPMSRCNECGKMVPAIPRGQEEGVLICFFVCGDQAHGDDIYRYVVRCRMQDTAPCYECKAQRCKTQVNPCHFQPPRKINRKTGATHNCSRCGGNGKCPNMHNPII